LGKDENNSFYKALFPTKRIEEIKGDRKAWDKGDDSHECHGNSDILTRLIIC